MCVGLLVLDGCNADSQGAADTGPPPVLVQVLKIEAGSLPQTLEAMGTLAAPERTTISAEIDEQIVDIEIPEGTRVEQSQVLVQLDDSRAQAALKSARARFENAQARMKRLESLRASSVSSEQAYDDALEGFEMGRAELDSAENQLAKTKIRAPFSGVLGLTRVTPGQYVKSGDPIVEITRVNPLDLVFGLPQERARELAVGQRVIGSVGTCGERFEGAITAVEPSVDPVTRTVSVKARVPNEAGALWTGMAASLRVVVAELPNAIRVPQEAVVREGGRYLVYVVDAQGRAAQKPVQLGTFFVDGVHVTSGLAAGDTVVVTGHQKLRPGALTRSEPYQPVRNPTLDLGWIGPADGCAG